MVTRRECLSTVPARPVYSSAGLLDWINRSEPIHSWGATVCGGLLSSSAGDLADDDRWKHLTSLSEVHNAALLISTSTVSAVSSEHKMGTWPTMVGAFIACLEIVNTFLNAKDGFSTFDCFSLCVFPSIPGNMFGEMKFSNLLSNYPL